ncbi:hypothetical protein ANRL3_02727 [Anaerolineae bacterium]|nr:hypothetical protein ANRL3_02727 [Anaerolineae bacterium]
MLSTATHFACPECNRSILKGSGLCKGCGHEFEAGDQKPCALCLQFKPLRKSHAIPDACFREISKGRQAIAVTDDGKYAKKTNDSWWIKQLCDDCETYLNKNYDAYSLARLRGGRGQKIQHNEYLTLQDVDFVKLYTFFLSVFWRAANSDNPAYRCVYIPQPWNEQIREYVLGQNPDLIGILKIATVRLSFLKDLREEKFLDDNCLSETIAEPFARLDEKNERASFNFIMKGFFVEIFTPGLRLSERKTKGIIDLRCIENNKLDCSFVHPYDIPELAKTIFVGVRPGFKKSKKKSRLPK